MGNMGLSMANNLVKSGFDVKGYDLSEQTLEKAEKMVCDENLFVFNDFFYIYRESLQLRPSKKCPLTSTISFHPSQGQQMLRQFSIKTGVFLKMQKKAHALLTLALFPQLLLKNSVMRHRKEK